MSLETSNHENPSPSPETLLPQAPKVLSETRLPLDAGQVTLLVDYIAETPQQPGGKAAGMTREARTAQASAFKAQEVWLWDGNYLSKHANW